MFEIICAIGIVFVVWGYANEQKLIDFEDRTMEKLKIKFDNRKNK